MKGKRISRLEGILDSLFDDRNETKDLDERDKINDKIIRFQLEYKKLTGRYYEKRQVYCS